MDVESLYLDLYDSVADRADYAQSDSPARNFLSETVIAALTAATLGAFVTGFAQAFGERITQGTVDRVRALLGRSAEGLGEAGGRPEASADDSTEPALEALRLLERYLPLLRESTSEQRAEEERWVARELEERGFPPHVAAAVSADMVARLRAAGGTVAEEGGSR
ncbi:hypothetical protein [Streptomyces sp. NBC_00572]|uniref:hypothetical protein n=1 Tax=Streptomyces sp. NBC_00572 TaxID=2903664 RepID=UPI00224CD43E|nr:hypothetical protein [Streptomyces sp. NBC_00572]MCX4986569.1 hypothetical protein [Streptomyces sp. NBC_00572]